MMVVGVVKKPVTFPQGTQRIARIGELCEPNTYVLEPAGEAPATEAPRPVATGDAPITDAELASAFVGEAPIAIRRTKTLTRAYTAVATDERATLTIA